MGHGHGVDSHDSHSLFDRKAKVSLEEIKQLMSRRVGAWHCDVGPTLPLRTRTVAILTANVIHRKGYPIRPPTYEGSIGTD